MFDILRKHLHQILSFLPSQQILLTSTKTQSVSVGDFNFSSLPLKYGVPQGSVLGRSLFTLYSQPVSDKTTKHYISLFTLYSQPVSDKTTKHNISLFTLYSQPVSDKTTKHNISYQKFADDTQLHKASQPREFPCLVQNLRF